MSRKSEALNKIINRRMINLGPGNKEARNVIQRVFWTDIQVGALMLMKSGRRCRRLRFPRREKKGSSLVGGSRQVLVP